MNRRDFVAAAGLAGMAPMSAAAALSRQEADQAYLELREYHLPLGADRRRLSDFLREAAIPAWNRLDLGPVGVFNVVYGQSKPSLYVLLSHPTIESVATLRARLEDDAAYKRAGAELLEAPLDEPAYVRVESKLMKAFSHMPRVEAPATDEARIFELRTYESHSEEAARRKIHMFNEGGEIQIFRDTGLTPVFFGETLIGPQMPNLTYMLTFADLAERDAAWATFVDAPAWKELSADRFYAGTVSNISDIILRPTSFSQI